MQTSQGQKKNAGQETRERFDRAYNETESL